MSHPLQYSARRRSQQRAQSRPERKDGGKAASYPFQPVFFKSTITTFAARNRAINERKKMRSRRSMTPAEIEVKWLRKLKEETALTSARGAHARKKSSTSGAPEMVNRKQTTTLTTKAIT